ncbi:hypothetical protein AJ78_05300 [Emergomyces pasteurianus Ep9510]|uniref:Major facilitator superfamily (MFS) profile domain-containing protein n=1 Tax=Emergomyces pasteurianus Ep9510 TaxID=1447872 RepID=A0A1J9QDX2_9EURO|nr:hypothetical protein AJ78_05300 [Emergomyces pasteurianus Ep9510]
MSANLAIHNGTQTHNGKHLTPNSNANLNEECAALAEKYISANSVKPILSEVFVKNSDLFRLLYEVFEHHLALVKSRSQALRDGQITVYDKALLELTGKGTEETYNMGAIQLFLDEVMGMKDAEAAHLEALVVKHVAVKSLLVNASRSNIEETTTSSPAIRGKKVTNGKAQGNKDKNGPTASNAKELKTINDSLTRILATFSNAQREYQLISDSDVVAKSRAAKFLRDTAENALNYLHARNMQHDMVQKLEAAFQMAKEKAIALSGGRKRPFEINEVDYRRGQRFSSSPRYVRRSSRSHTASMLDVENQPLPGRFMNTASSSIAEDTPPSSSFTTDSQLTPEEGSSGSRDGDVQSSNREQQLPGLGRLQTNFDGDGNNKFLTEFRELEHHDYSIDAGGFGDDYISPNAAEAFDFTDETGSKSYTIDEEKGVVRKFDIRLTMFMALLYMLSFLDRSNIGNARIAGLEKDLKLTSPQFEWVLTAFYITYICFEWMTLMYRVVPAHIYISICCFSWGLIAACQSLVSSFWSLVLLRALLGIAEAAFGPGLPFYLSFFYKREELAYRTGMFISAAPLATSFASTLAWAIVKLSDDGPLAPWRALFLLEGFPSVIVAVFAWIYVPDSPGKARYLTPRQRKVAKLRLKMSDGTRYKDKSRERRFDWKEIGRTLRDPKSYLTALMFCSCNVAFSSMPVFLPTILKDMGYPAQTSQALSAPPYILSFLVVLLTASLSDRQRTRSPYLIAHALVSSAAYITIALAGHFRTHLSSTLLILIRYIAIYPATAGFFSSITIIITWTMDNQPAKEGKGTGMAILNIIGQCGPLVGTRLYPQTDGPWYVKGMAVCALFMLLVAVLAFALRMILHKENERALMGTAAVDADEIEMVEGEAAGLMGRGSGPGSGSGSASLHPVIREKSVDKDRFIYII